MTFLQKQRNYQILVCKGFEDVLKNVGKLVFYCFFTLRDIILDIKMKFHYYLYYNNEQSKGEIMSDYIITYTGTKFYPVTPIAKDIHIEDIAHALSLMTRANGHFKHFYSVGLHCLNCVREAKARGFSKRVQLGCLLHDASEAYLSDITRPVKQHLHKYKEIEKHLQDMIFAHFGLGDLKEEEVEQIFQMDDVVLHHEFLFFREVGVFDNMPPMISEPDFEERRFKDVEDRFLALFKELKV